MALAFGGDMAERDKRSRPGRVTLLLFLLAVALLGLVVLRAYQARTTGLAMTEVPVLRADDAPTRQRPKDPGGMQVPHADSPVFRNLEGGAKEPVVERLLPPPEAPMPKPVAVMATEESVPLPPAIPASPPPSETVGASTLSPSELVGETPPDVSATLSAPDDPARPHAPTTETAMTLQLPIPTNPAEGYRVQLGAFRAAAQASRGWERALAAAPELLGPVSHFVFQTDLGAAKGVFHRLQAGPLPSRESADSLCNQLKVKKVDCYVVSP